MNCGRQWASDCSYRMRRISASTRPLPPTRSPDPPTDAGSVGRFRPTVEFERRIRVQATVTAVETGLLYVSDGQGFLAVRGQEGCLLKPGDSGDFVGFPGPVFGRPGLQDAQCRKLNGGGGGPKAVATTADAILPEQNFTDPSGKGQAVATRFDMRPVRIEGTLLQVSPGPDSDTLILESGEKPFCSHSAGLRQEFPVAVGRQRRSNSAHRNLPDYLRSVSSGPVPSESC